MGYATSYSLELTKLDGVQFQPPKIEDVIAELHTKKVKQADILQQLEQIHIGENLDVTEEIIIERLRDTNDNASYALDEEGNISESCKWYDHEEEMKVFSKQYPNWLFTLKGEGEESQDIWHKYFVNGKVQSEEAKITIDPFDPKKLK